MSLKEYIKALPEGYPDSMEVLISAKAYDKSLKNGWITESKDNKGTITLKGGEGIKYRVVDVA